MKIDRVRVMLQRKEETRFNAVITKGSLCSRYHVHLSLPTLPATSAVLPKAQVCPSAEP